MNKDFQRVCFAPIDLKDADFYVYDGFDVSGVTNTAEEPADETVIALSDCDEIVPVGCVVRFENDSTNTPYVVASRTTSGGVDAVFVLDLDGSSSGEFTLTFDGQVTNSIAYDADAALIQLELEALDGIGNGDVLVEVGSDFTITFQDDLASTNITTTQFTLQTGTLNGSEPTLTRTVQGVADDSTLTITLESGLEEVVEAGGDVYFDGRRLEIKIGEGNLTYNEIKNREYIKNRGVLDTVRNADEEPMEVSFEFTWEWITAATADSVPTLEDVLKKRGKAADWETSDAADPCAPYCVDIVLYYNPVCADVDREKITLSKFRYESLNHNIRDSQISCTGKCNVTEATVERS